MTQLFPSLPSTGGRPLQHVKTLTGLSRRRLSVEDVLDLIENRQIKWAWNIARKDAARPELRFWRDSLLNYFVRESGAGEPSSLSEEIPIEHVIANILPRCAAPHSPASVIRAADLSQRFLCCSNHILGLVRDGELKSAGPLQANVATAIRYHNAYEFLQRRCLTL
ncbi:MAG TPA: hypothetical protein VFC44_07745 [Candidatus Saccharimonadales bacterium]|nr:hypothetical protein [Candidatus Saccharimonadales bacterium]